MDTTTFLKNKGISDTTINNLSISDLLSEFSEILISEKNEANLRLLAEFENYKKRVRKEKDNLVNDTKIELMSSILDIDSDIYIAIEKIKNEEAKDGLKLIMKKLESFLQSQGIESIQTDTYDPDLHEVITVLKKSDTPKIVDVVSKGYKINDRPFRYPKIILA